MSRHCQDNAAFNRLQANKVRICRSLESKGTNNFGDVTVTGTLDISKANIIYPPKGAFYGWWKRLSKGVGDEEYFFIDDTDPENILFNGYGGNVEYGYEYPFDDSYQAVKISDQVLKLPFDASVTATVNGISATFPTNEDFYLIIQNLDNQYQKLMWFQFNDVDKNVLNPGSAEGLFYEKLGSNFDPSTIIRPYGNGDNAFIDSNSRRFMFQQINAMMFVDDMPAFSPSGQADLLLTQPQRTALFDRIMNIGIQRPSSVIYDIYKTTKDSETTTILIKGVWPQMFTSTEIMISGLQAEWSVLNGKKFNLGSVYMIDPDNTDNQETWIAENRLYHLLVRVDTSNLPTFTSRFLSGINSIVQPNYIGPITEDIEYKAFVDAYLYYISQVVKIAQHTFIYQLQKLVSDAADSLYRQTTLDTWKEVSEYALNGNNAYIGIRGFNSYWGETAPLYYLPERAYDGLALNQPFLELGFPDSSYPPYIQGKFPEIGYQIPFQNYILPDSRRWLYFRIKPDTPVNNDQQQNVWVLGYNSDGTLNPLLRGYASVGPNGLNTQGQLGGSRFEGKLFTVPYGEDSAELAAGFWSPFDFNGPFSTFWDLNIGIVDPAIVGGHKFGYLHLDYNLLIDYYSVSLNANFGNPALLASPDPAVQKRIQYDASREVISKIMQYFNEQQVEAIILDNRYNFGYFVNYPLVESFGGIRQGDYDLEAFQNQDNRDPINTITDIQSYSGIYLDNKTITVLNDTVPWTQVRPDLQEIDYPGSVFKNGKVIILSSPLQNSGGNQLARYFMGNNYDGDLGNGVQCKFVGNTYSMLTGYVSNPADIITSKYGSEFKNPDGTGFAPVNVQTNTLIYNNIGGLPISTRYHPDTHKPIQALIPYNSNLRGPIYSGINTGDLHLKQGPLSMNLEDTVYFDFGYRGPGTAVDGTPYSPGHWDNPPTGFTPVDNFPGQPVPTDYSSFRDSWFEESVRVGLLMLGDLSSKAGIIDATLKRSYINDLHQILKKNQHKMTKEFFQQREQRNRMAHTKTKN